MRCRRLFLLQVLVQGEDQDAQSEYTAGRCWDLLMI
jgi:hypothetical protein